jgi:hypothetical protein
MSGPLPSHASDTFKECWVPGFSSPGEERPGGQHSWGQVELAPSVSAMSTAVIPDL